jgi:hypothetical protein
MKRKRSAIDNGHAKKVACTVSAAALMLGVSQAATVGFNFQAHYCAADSYSGAVVTAPAFGIGTNSWENLSEMDTGYGCPAGYYVLPTTIDTTSSDPGLNPLPNGSVTITLSGYTANVSGFGGYSRTGPHYTFGGNRYKPGNEQVYWGFVRDGVNFGPGSSGGDNNQPGYQIDITGLKSLFTNSSFAVQLIASSDSMQYLTNAFIIDATANTTQSVVYPSTPPVADVGDTAWVRGIGGGLSTASGNLTTDHLKIIGNRAAHVGPKSGYNFASTIAGFIVTDKPVISMSPNSILTCGGDSFTLSAYAVGATPLSYQWRKDGVAIAGATNLSYSITNVQFANAGSYDLLVNNLYGQAISDPAVVTVDKILTTPGKNFVVDSNPSNPAHDGIATGATWLASSGTRNGVMSFNSAHPDQITVPGETNFDSSTGTIMFWMRSTGATGTNAAALFDRRNPNGCVIALGTNGAIQFQASVGNQNQFASTSTKLGDNNWHLVTLVYDQSVNGEVDIYIDGALDDNNFNADAWSWTVGQELEFGLSHDTNSWAPYNGLMDDIRFYNRALTAQEISSVFSAGNLVDTNALMMRLNFDTAPVAGATLRWQCPDAILQSSDSVNGPFKDIPSGSSPYPAAVRGAEKFFRYRGHVPGTVLSNPYLM